MRIDCNLVAEIVQNSTFFAQNCAIGCMKMNGLNNFVYLRHYLKYLWHPGTPEIFAR